MTSLETDMRRLGLSLGGSDRMTSKTKSLLRTLKHKAAHWAVAILYPWPRAKRLKNGLTLKIDPKRRWIDLNLALRSHYEEGTLLLIEKLLLEEGVLVDMYAGIANSARRFSFRKNYRYHFDSAMLADRVNAT